MYRLQLIKLEFIKISKNQKKEELFVLFSKHTNIILINTLS